MTGYTPPKPYHWDREQRLSAITYWNPPLFLEVEHHIIIEEEEEGDVPVGT